MIKLNNELTNMFHMEQKDYTLEIISFLIRGDGHIREIGEKIGVNHMMIVRKMKELLELNIVDFVQEGRNKNYFLKKNAESYIYILMAEYYKLLRLLEKNQFLGEVIEKIQKDKRIKLAILFGSYAKGIQKKDSDIDIFIETTNLTIKKEYSNLNSKLSIKIGKLGNDYLSKEIRKNSVIIKGVEKYHEQFFE